MPRFVVVTGLPASGKSTFGHRLSSALALPLLDKDDILEALVGPLAIGPCLQIDTNGAIDVDDLIGRLLAT